MSKVPVLVGDMKDEGTLFSLINSLNTTTDEQVKDYFKTFWWPNATESQLDELLVQYPVDKGAPYDAALSLPLLPQFGRVASITGDYSFEVSSGPSRIRSKLVFESASLHGVDKSSRTHHVDIGPTPPSLEQPPRKALELPHHRPASRSRPGLTHRRPARRFSRRPHGAPSPRLLPRRRCRLVSLRHAPADGQPQQHPHHEHLHLLCQPFGSELARSRGLAAVARVGPRRCSDVPVQGIRGGGHPGRLPPRGHGLPRCSGGDVQDLRGEGFGVWVWNLEDDAWSLTMQMDQRGCC